MLKYKRILIKLSGEALAGNKERGLDYDTVVRICRAIKETAALGAEIAVVVGGGNFWRGRDNANMERSRADHIGMLATVMNGLAVADALEQMDVPVRVMTAIPMQQVAEPYIRNRAIRHLEKGRVIILAGGTGNPYFSTDTTAALRAAEIGADVILKATLVDGVYDKDPHKYKDAVKYDALSFSTVLNNGLQVIDSTAASMCRDNHIPLLVFDLQHDPENLVRAVRGENIGTVIEEA
ncbi:MAG: UMP kinase [Oscillospiraceae bacterium]|nr:UMP kinase [Oscillospiraceae bacterium]